MTSFAIDTPSTTSALAPRRLPPFYAAIVGAVMTCTTVGVTLPRTLTMEFTYLWTSGAARAPRVDTASAVRGLKSRSGLSWQQLADAFGVSRRSLHFWANGGNMATASAQRLEALTQIVDGHAPAEPAAVRAALISSRASGRSQLEELIGEVTPRRIAARVSVADQLNAVGDDTKHPGSVRSSRTLPVKLAEF